MQEMWQTRAWMINHRLKRQQQFFKRRWFKVKCTAVVLRCTACLYFGWILLLSPFCLSGAPEVHKSTNSITVSAFTLMVREILRAEGWKWLLCCCVSTSSYLNDWAGLLLLTAKMTYITTVKKRFAAYLLANVAPDHCCAGAVWLGLAN